MNAQTPAQRMAIILDNLSCYTDGEWWAFRSGYEAHATIGPDGHLTCLEKDSREFCPDPYASQVDREAYLSGFEAAHLVDEELGR